MLKQISWIEYFITLFVLLTVYYLAVFFIYYRNDFWNLLNGNKKLSPEGPFNDQGKHPTVEQSDNHNTGQPIHTTEIDKFYDVVDHVIPELKTIFENDYVKEELVTAIKQQLKNYGHIKGSAFQVAVNNFIKIEAERNCSIMFNEDEISVLWS